MIKHLIVIQIIKWLNGLINAPKMIQFTFSWLWTYTRHTKNSKRDLSNYCKALLTNLLIQCHWFYLYKCFRSVLAPIGPTSADKWYRYKIRPYGICSTLLTYTTFTNQLLRPLIPWISSRIKDSITYINELICWVHGAIKCYIVSYKYVRLCYTVTVLDMGI